MISNIYKLIFIVAVFGLVSGGCNIYYRNMPFAEIPPQKVSDAVEINFDWKEIAAPQPLTPNGRTNWINLGYKDFKKIEFINEPNKDNILELADGRKTRIDAILFDDEGTEYELKLSLTSSGPELHKKGEVKIVSGQPDYSATKFPDERVYTKLKIRSEIPLRCDKIEWIGSNPK